MFIALLYKCITNHPIERHSEVPPFGGDEAQSVFPYFKIVTVQESPFFI